MKKMFFILAMISSLSLSACSGEQTQPEDTTEVSKSQTSGAETNSEVDLDLTQLSSTMVYAEVYNMMIAPDHFVGKTVRMTGKFTVNKAVGGVYFTCLISDATECCSQGIEFELAGDHVYPDDYPRAGSTITVTGEFTTYNVNNMRYTKIVDAVME